jgi:predicted transcriptional regulator YdeE
MLPITLIGVSLPDKTTNENYQSAKDIGDLWNTFWQENVIAQIPKRMSDEIYAVYYNYEGNHTRPYSFFIGCQASADVETPEGLYKLQIPSGDYRKFTAKGKMPDCIMNAWSEIWKSDIPRAFDVDYEVYDERALDMDDAEVDIFVSVE